MKKRITRLPPHRNGVMAGVLFATSAVLVLMPVFLLMAIAGGDETFPLWLVLVFPVFYLVMGYIWTALSCWIYNLLAPHVGGFEYEAE
ncbi:MAG: hypothetical protein WD081_03995 [Gammaproteobacteria bacterium]